MPYFPSGAINNEGTKMNITAELLNATSAGRATWDACLYIETSSTGDIEITVRVIATFSYTPAEPQMGSYPGVSEAVEIESIELEGLSGPVAGQAVAALQIRVQYIEADILDEIQRQRRQSKDEADAA
ncbi:MAG: hypothetical protein RPU15_08770 [Candidatus Sedimenticola sp. (ex Thyasira tokunagai)]